MGTNNSKQSIDVDNPSNKDNKNKICVNCQKDEQVHHPMNGLDPCSLQYDTVDACMKSNHGQISSCAKEWDAFNKCFIKHKEQHQQSAP